MKIVIVCRYFYPKLTPRAFRATELAKEFARLGHDVTAYAVLGKTNYAQFEAETGIKVRPIKTRFSTANSDGGGRYNFFDKIAYHSLHRALEYPDIEFAWKVPQILKQERNVDLLITVAIPHTIHWGAAIAKRKYPSTFPKMWVSDCGDPYLGNSVGKKHPFYFRSWEKFWCNNTDFITVPVNNALSAYPYAKSEQITVIPQGFDFSATPTAQYVPNVIPTFCYSGVVYPGYRDPTSFLEYLSSVEKDFKFIVYGGGAFYDKFKHRLGNRLEQRDYVPRADLIREISKCDFLINLKNQSDVQAPSKLIDYKLSGRPIIDIGTPFNEVEAIERAMNGYPSDDHADFDLEVYNIKNVAQQFLSLCKR